MTGNSSSAGCASRNGSCEWVVFVDVGSALHEAHLDEHAGHEAALLGCRDVAPSTWDLLCDGGLNTLREGTGSGGVDDGGVWACSVGSDDVDCAGDGASVGDLRKSAAGLGHDGAHAGEGVGAGLSLSETVGCGLSGVEDGGVDFGLLVGSGTWDDSSLDTESSGVSTGITGLGCVSLFYGDGRLKEGCYPYQDSNLAMGSNEWGCCESEEDDFGKHICDGWIWSKKDT